MADTIFAVSSGRPPAAIAVIRVSGALAMACAQSLAGNIPEPRRATLRQIRNADGLLLDRALLLAFPGPESATGEDLLEIHAHGGPAVVAAIEAALAAMAGVRRAEPGEFTRRALEHGRLDLSQAEALADLLAAETETQRRQAIRASEGELSAAVIAWMDHLAAIAAMIEVAIDYDGEENSGDPEEAALRATCAVRDDIALALARPPVERLHDGIRIVLAGPRNAGKSTLFNALVARDAAITSPIAGTTRDLIEASVQRGGRAYVLVDTAGIVAETADPIEAIGIERAGQAIAHADVVLWLGDEVPPEQNGMIAVHPRADLHGREIAPEGRIAVSAGDAASVERVWRAIDAKANLMIPAVDVMFNNRQRRALREAWSAIADPDDELLLLAEQLRVATRSLAAVIGVDATESMLDMLFSRFCLGK
ncbi:tRNA modification GTPase MnmE [Sphingomonas sp. EC-HK361]|uniref:tRNA uridine-5-carboxymethylaminomethyl(34) synthesis GTPase MnmE n=1 Tax=Sphingomonas sp. EC-HK361 TaxID=2038397 RepID=UPI001257830C|nr:tRNA uridine-5-carboxymethylaminomethyl(34) synthesis GTPase MnmE [Sphingomonas sp. EC-HK361]VVS97740.1 tRNA modification GTPase MnmE [Sphingomonas sp. EC-HK361]